MINLTRVWVVANIFEHDLAGLHAATWPTSQSKPIRTAIFTAASRISAMKSIGPPRRSARELKFPIPTIC